jgi:uncharacterized protein (TIGR02444 family)
MPSLSPSSGEAEQDDLAVTRTEAGFWDFSLRFYALPGVAPACLRCQDEAGADVNVVLFLLWKAASGQRVGEDGVRAAEEASVAWRAQVVKPLRAVRRGLKEAALAAVDRDGRFRPQMQALELEAERLQQETLARLTIPHAEAYGAPNIAAANLVAYERATGLNLPPDAVSALLVAFSGR